MSLKDYEVARHRTAEAHLGAGWRSPQIQIQITPLKWGLEAIYCTTGGIPTKFGWTIGCVSIVVYVGPAPLEASCDAGCREHVTYTRKKEDG